MVKLLNKELRLTTSPLTFIFLAFCVMTFIPGYPILMGAFFVCLGIFQSFHQTRVTNDLLYTALLPIRKKDVVRSKFIMVGFFEGVAFILFAIFTVLRMTVMKEEIVYKENYMMNANLVFLGFVLLIYLAFNCIFVTGFLKTAYKINKPYLLFVGVSIVLIGIGEALHFIPSFSYLNANLGSGQPGSDAGQIIFLIICLVLYVGGTFLTCRAATKRFEKLDL